MNYAIEFANTRIESDDNVIAIGVIVYTNRHANLKKVLDDRDYWNALDEVSGSRLQVLAVRATEGRAERPPNPPTTLASMHSVWNEPKANEQLLKDFNIESTEDALLLIFIPVGSDEIYKHILPLSDETRDSAFTTLKAALSLVGAAVGDIKPENLRNAEGVDAALGYAIANYQQFQLFKKGISIYKWIKALYPA